MSPNHCKISVVLPVYNGAKTIERAVASVLGQTYKNFELLVINDGSTDGTLTILQKFTDPRVKIINQENHGLAYSLNQGIKQSQGQFIARMDADDESLPSRFEKQVRFLETNLGIAAVGTQVLSIYENGKKIVRRRPTSPEKLRDNIVKICPLVHPSVMARRATLNAVGGYDESKDGATKQLVEDYDLWVRLLAAGYELANIDEVLLRYYMEPGSIFRKRSLKKRLKQQIVSRKEAIRLLGLSWINYLHIVPVVIVSILDYYGVKIDKFFNLIARK